MKSNSRGAWRCTHTSGRARLVVWWAGAPASALNTRLAQGKPEKIVEKIVDGKMEKFYAENCLLEQAFVKDTTISINELIANNIAKIGENIVVRRFTRYALGEHS